MTDSNLSRSHLKDCREAAFASVAQHQQESFDLLRSELKTLSDLFEKAGVAGYFSFYPKVILRSPLSFSSGNKFPGKTYPFRRSYVSRHIPNIQPGVSS